MREKLTQQDIADRVGSSREMVNRVMKDLTTGGYVVVRDGRHVILRKLPRRALAPARQSEASPLRNDGRHTAEPSWRRQATCRAKKTTTNSEAAAKTQRGADEGGGEIFVGVFMTGSLWIGRRDGFPTTRVDSLVEGPGPGPSEESASGRVTCSHPDSARRAASA